MKVDRYHHEKTTEQSHTTDEIEGDDMFLPDEEVDTDDNISPSVRALMAKFVVPYCCIN